MAAKKLPDQAWLRQRLEYDRETGFLTWKARPVSDFKGQREQVLWNGHYAGKMAGGISHHRHTDYVTIAIAGSRYLAHRIIWKMETGDEPPEVDHRDNDGTHNWFSNLRGATKTKNMQNSRKRSQNKTFKGVRFVQGGWQARITVNKKTHHLGSFRSAEEAHAAYCAAAREHFGEFANFGHSLPQSTLP